MCMVMDSKLGFRDVDTRKIYTIRLGWMDG